MTERDQGKTIGLDAHPDMFTMAVVSGSDARTAKVEKVVDRAPMGELVRLIGKHATEQDVVVLEASTNSFLVVKLLAEAGIRAVVVGSDTVSKMGSQYAVTDRIDAIKLARAWIAGLAKIVWTPDGKAAERRTLYFAYRNAKKDATRQRNRLWNWCCMNGLRAPKKRRLKAVPEFERLVGLPRWTPLQRGILEDMVRTYRLACDRRERYAGLMTEEVVSDPQTLRLMRLLGVRSIVAFALVAFIGNIDRFADPKKLVAYVGLNPNVCRSGKGGGNGPLPHAGRSDLRSLLVQAAHSMLRWSKGSIREWGLRLCARKGRNIAVCGVARKLTVAIWYVLKGLYVPEIADTSLRTKLAKMAVEIGRDRLQAMGFTKPEHFIEEKFQIIRSFA